MYSVTNLTTIADCDVLLTMANKELGDLTFKKLSEERLVTNYSTTSVEIDAVLQGVLAEISAVDTIIAALPEGPTKETEEKRSVKQLIEEDYLPNALSYGIDRKTFMHLNPTKLKAYDKAEQIKMKARMIESERMAYMNGFYVLNALGAAFGKGEYPKEPIGLLTLKL